MDIYGNAVSGKYTGTIFPIAFAHFVSLSDFDNSCSISNHFIIIMFIILICDQWLLMLLPYKCLMVSILLTIKYLKLGYVHFLYIMLLYITRLQYSINITFICTEKQNIHITWFILIFKISLRPACT